MNQVAAQVMETYGQIDHQIDAFQTATQLHCPPGCGWCCENPQVEATPLELLPLAIELFRQGQAEQWLEQLSDRPTHSICVFYQPDPQISGNGRCQMYQWRPTICRLFGFAAVTNRDGYPELAVCARHKAALPDRVTQAQAAVQAGLEAPHFAELSQQIANLDPYLGVQRMPINLALRTALERVGLAMQMSEETANEIF